MHGLLGRPSRGDSMLLPFATPAAAADGAKAAGSASPAHPVRTDRGELAGEPHPEGVPEGFLPGAAGHALPGCRSGERSGTTPLRLRRKVKRMYGCG